MAKPGKLQTSLEYALARTILSGLGVLPRPVAIAVGLVIGRLAYLLPGNLRRTGKRNLEIAFPEMLEAELSGLVLDLQLQSTAIFVVFLLVLLFRPQGLFGRSADRT